MNANTIHLNVFPSYQEVKQFLNGILPRLQACGLTMTHWPYGSEKSKFGIKQDGVVLCDFSVLTETEDGHATFGGLLEVSDLGEIVYSVSDCINYGDMTVLAETLERKQVELQLNALLPRMAAVGWTFKVELGAAFLGDISDPPRAPKLLRDGKEEDFVPTYTNLDRLRKDLIRTEATRWVQQYWLELEAAGCEVTLGTDVIVVHWQKDQRIYGYTLEEAKDLINTVLSPFNTDPTV